jgi:hypothetical protein
VSADPVYELSRDELMRRVWNDIERTHAWAATQRDTVNWSYASTFHDL